MLHLHKLVCQCGSWKGELLTKDVRGASVLVRPSQARGHLRKLSEGAGGNAG